MNHLRWLTSLSATLALGAAFVLAAAPAHARQTASQACFGASARTGPTTVVTVPRVAGFRFSINGARYQTGPDGAVNLVRSRCKLTYRLHVLTPTMPLGQGRQVRFARWSGEFNGESLLFARFDTYSLVRFTFQEGTGRPIDRRLLGVVTLKSDVGQIVHLPTDADRWWLQSSRVVAGLNIRPTYWTVQSVPADGSNVVTASKIKFFPGRTSSVRITLLYFSLTLRVKDRLFGWPVGSSVELRFPSGHRALYHLGPDGRLSLPSVPRGIYALRVNGPVVKVWRPVALSRDQDVALDTLSYLDVAVLGGFGLLIIIGPLVAGRLLRTPRTNRRRKPQRVRAEEAQGAEEIGKASAAPQEVALAVAAPREVALPEVAQQKIALAEVALPDVPEEDVLHDDTLPDDAVRDEAPADVPLSDDALSDDTVPMEPIWVDGGLAEAVRQVLPDDAAHVEEVTDDPLHNDTVTADTAQNPATADTVAFYPIQDDPVAADTAQDETAQEDPVAVDMAQEETAQDETITDNIVADEPAADTVADRALRNGGLPPDAVQIAFWEDTPREDALQKALREDALHKAAQEEALQEADWTDGRVKDPLVLALWQDGLREDPLQTVLPEDPLKLALQEDALQMALRDDAFHGDALYDDMTHEDAFHEDPPAEGDFGQTFDADAPYADAPYADAPHDDSPNGAAPHDDTLHEDADETRLQEGGQQEGGQQEGGLQVALQVAALQAAALAEDASP